MICDLHAPATVDNLLHYCDGKITHNTQIPDLLNAITAATASLARRIFLEMTALVSANCEKESLLKARAIQKLDAQILSAAFESFRNPAKGYAQKVFLTWKRRQIETHTQNYKQLLSQQQLEDPHTHQTIRIAHLIGDELLPQSEHATRANRFAAYYLEKQEEDATIISHLFDFLSLPGSIDELPPLFLNSTISLEETGEIDKQTQCHFWLSIAKLRTEQQEGDRGAADKRQAQITTQLQAKLRSKVGNIAADARMEFLMRWLRPKAETPIFRTAFRLPLLELLTSHTQKAGMHSLHEQRELLKKILRKGENISAHGISLRRGGLKTLINVMLEGQLDTATVGPLTDGDPEKVAGPHGPYFVLLSNKQRGETSKVREKEHIIYLVPDESDKAFATEIISDAYQQGFLTHREKENIAQKVLTYKELLALKKEDANGLFKL